jgi:hypothetical protein
LALQSGPRGTFGIEAQLGPPGGVPSYPRMWQSASAGCPQSLARTPTLEPALRPLVGPAQSKAAAATILDDASAMPQRDSRLGPPLAGGLVGRQGHLKSSAPARCSMMYSPSLVHMSMRKVSACGSSWRCSKADHKFASKSGGVPKVALELGGVASNLEIAGGGIYRLEVVDGEARQNLRWRSGHV